MLGYFTKRAAYRCWCDETEAHLQGLFVGIKPEIVRQMRKLTDIEGIKRSVFAQREVTPRTCAVLIAGLLFGKALQPLTTEERRGTLKAIYDGDLSHRVARGLHDMMATASAWGEEQGARAIGYEVIGVLRGMSVEEISRWRQGEEMKRIIEG